jgi:hypothetical protein
MDKSNRKIGVIDIVSSGYLSAEGKGPARRKLSSKYAHYAGLVSVYHYEIKETVEDPAKKSSEMALKFP